MRRGGWNGRRVSLILREDLQSGVLLPRGCARGSFHGQLGRIKPTVRIQYFIPRGFHCAVPQYPGDYVWLAVLLVKTFAPVNGRRAAQRVSRTGTPVHGAEAAGRLVKYDAYLLIRSKLYPHYTTSSPVAATFPRSRFL